MNRKEIFTGIAFIVFSLVVYLQSGTYPSPPNAVYAASPGFYPQMLSILVFILALFVIGFAIHEKKTSVPKESPLEKGSRSSLIVILVLMFASPFILKWGGIFIGGGLFLFLGMVKLSEKRLNLKDLGLSIIFAAVLVFVVYLIFEVIIKLPMPRGVLPRVF